MSAGQMKHANRWHLRPMRCCGLPTARTATLLLAALGLVSHLRLFSSIGTLQDSFPSVPLAQQASVLDVPFATLASGPQRVQEGASNTSPAPSLLASPSLASGRNATQTTLPQADEPETWAWHNLLPHYHTGNADTLQILHNIPDEATAGGRERQNWQSARLVTRTLRVYALLSAAASLAGVIGVLKVRRVRGSDTEVQYHVYAESLPRAPADNNFSARTTIILSLPYSQRASLCSHPSLTSSSSRCPS